MTDGDSMRVSRRALLTAAGVGSVALTDTAATATLQDDATPEPGTRVGPFPLTGNMPAWELTVHDVQDPYEGELTDPESPDPARRYAAIDVQVRNRSNRPLTVVGGNFRLRSADGVDFTTGGVNGVDPRLFEVNLLPGESVRGWVYFGVPRDAQLVSIVYQPPAPQIVVTIP